MSVTPQVGSLAKIESKKMIKLLSSNIRVDGRGLDSYRPIQIETGVIDKAEGSASVLLGNTKVLVGIKIETGEPYPDTPDQGVFTVNAEFLPLAHKFFEPGPPDENSIELARIVDRGIRGSEMVEVEKLAIIPKRSVYVIFVDIYILNHDGNLIDASEFATIAALANVKFPRYQVVEGEEVKKTEETFALPIKDCPISITMVKIDDKILIDPTSDEENMCSAKLTITITKDGNVCAIQKSGSGMFTPQEIIEAQKKAKEKSREIREKFFKEWC